MCNWYGADARKRLMVTANWSVAPIARSYSHSRLKCVGVRRQVIAHFNVPNNSVDGDGLKTKNESGMMDDRVALLLIQFIGK